MNGLTSRIRGWVNGYKTPVGVFLVTRLGLIVVVYLGLVFIQYDDATKLRRVYPRSLTQGFYGWDSGWYGRIALEGYDNTPNASGQRDTTFWPLYPLIVRAAATLLGDVRVAGVAVSNAAFLCGLLLLFHLARDKLGPVNASRTVVLMSIYPFSFYFSAVYTESLFFLACVAAFHFGERRNWMMAGLCAAAAGGTKFVGVLVMLGLAALYLERVDFNPKRLKPDFLWILLGLLGPLSYILFLEVRFGEPLVFWWGRNVPGWQAGVNFDLFVREMRNLSTLSFDQGNLNIIFGFIGLGLSLASWRYAGKAYCLWSTASILVTCFNFPGLGRYVAPHFPVFMAMAGLLRHDGLYASVCFWSVMALTLLSIMFSHGCWVT